MKMVNYSNASIYFVELMKLKKKAGNNDLSANIYNNLDIPKILFVVKNKIVTFSLQQCVTS